MSVAPPYHDALGVRIEETAPDRIRLRIPYADANSNPGRALHGGVAASAIDIAGTLAAHSDAGDLDGRESRTLDLSVDYLAAAIGEDIVVEGRVLRRGKELAYVDVDVRTDAGKAIAKGLVTHRIAPPAPAERLLVPTAEAPPRDGDIPPLATALVSLPFIARLGMAITHLRGGEAVITMPFRPATADRDEGVHEGTLAALLDTTGAMAAWSLVGLDLRLKASTVGLHVSYHTAARREDVLAVGRTQSRSNEIFSNAVTVSGRTSGRVLATGTVTYRIVVP